MNGANETPSRYANDRNKKLRLYTILRHHTHTHASLKNIKVIYVFLKIQYDKK